MKVPKTSGEFREFLSLAPVGTRFKFVGEKETNWTSTGNAEWISNNGNIRAFAYLKAYFFKGITILDEPYAPPETALTEAQVQAVWLMVNERLEAEYERGKADGYKKGYSYGHADGSSDAGYADHPLY